MKLLLLHSDNLITNSTTETYNTNYNTNTTGKTDITVKKIIFYNINTLQTVSNTIKNNYNLNTFKNTTFKI